LHWQVEAIQPGQILPATVVAELEFDSVNKKPPPDTIEEDDEGQ